MVEIDDNDPQMHERGLDRSRRLGEERLTASEPDMDAFEAGLTTSETRHVDGTVEIARQAIAAGLSEDVLEALKGEPTSPEYEEALDKVLMSGAVNKRWAGMVALLDRKIAEITGGEAPQPEAAAETEADGEGGDFLDLFGAAETSDDQIDILRAVTADEESAGQLFDQLSAAGGDRDAMEALIAAAMAERQAEGAEEASEVERLRLDNILLSLETANPQGVRAMRALIAGGSIEDQVAALQAFHDGRPPAEVDRNNPARPLRAGFDSSLTADGMSDEAADAILSSVGKGGLISSRRAG